MRWNDVVTLVDLTPAQDDLGSWVTPDIDDAPKRQVFCNRRSVSFMHRGDYVDVGMELAAEVQVRTCDYHGETKAVYHGERYDCESSASGDLTVLTLGRRLEDA